jgi:radical SAM superfamily enzyme YgiQ (UPF0313 family)
MIARDEELLELAVASGCSGLFIGFETLSPANLESIGKKVNRVDEYEVAIKKIHSAHIPIHGFFIVGLDADDEGVFQRTINFVQEMHLESAQFTWPIPYPGTAFFSSLNKDGRILTKDWSQYEFNVVFQPTLMSREVLQEQRDWTWRKFYSLSSIWKRVGIFRRNWKEMWAINLYYRSLWHKEFRTTE